MNYMISQGSRPDNAGERHRRLDYWSQQLVGCLRASATLLAHLAHISFDALDVGVKCIITRAKIQESSFAGLTKIGNHVHH
jgi:hypothetical protein